MAWDKSTGLITWEQDAKGEWINYSDGNVPIPPGPGFENEPPLMVPYYHSFNEAMVAVTDELPWGELAEIFRDKQATHNKWLVGTYWRPLKTTFGGMIGLHVTNNPTLEAVVWIEDVELSEGKYVMRLNYQSEKTDNYHVDALVFGDAKQINNEIRRIDECVEGNKNASDLAELCKSDTIEIPATVK